MSEAVVVQCPSCASRYRVGPEKLGHTLVCAKCQHPFTVTAVGQAAVVAPPPPLQLRPGAVPPPVPPQAMGYATPGGLDPYAGRQPGTSGMAIASLVLGLAFCIPLCSLLALIFGIIGITQTKAGMARGRGMAVTGTVLGSLGLLVTPLLLVSILLPSLSRAREIANRAKCASNMHQIGLGILLYQQDHNKEYPPDLATLWKTEQLSGTAFVCPSSNDTAAASPAQLTSGGHLSYVYLKPSTNDPDATTPILYENGADHGNDGTNVLFGDGHVDWETAAAAKRILAGTAAGGGT